MTAQVAPGSGQMFDGIAARYDLLNRVISFGLDRAWRRKTVKAMELTAGAQVLDVATGTADVAIEIAQQLHALDSKGSRTAATVVGVDPSVRMLDIARSKVARLGLSETSFLEGEGESLPFREDSFDATSIAFGIRNVGDRPKALQEMLRVTRSGGRVAILELSEPPKGIMGSLARFHVHTVVPTVGGWLSGSREYRYLQKSIAAFPEASVFADQMRDAGYAQVDVTPLTFGVCHLYVGHVP